MKRVIYASPDRKFRITEQADIDYQMEDLKGDTFNPKVNSDISEVRLALEELAFERFVERVGVCGYVLEAWDPESDQGWQHVDSCWGFVGEYDPSNDAFDHYIVEEMIARIKELSSNEKGD